MRSGSTFSAGNLLIGFGFFDPYWLVSTANIFVFIHLIGGYQVYLQPFMAFVETRIQFAFPSVPYLYNEYSFQCPGSGRVPFSILRIVSRSTIVCLTTLIVSFRNLFPTHTWRLWDCLLSLTIPCSFQLMSLQAHWTNVRYWSAHISSNLQIMPSCIEYVSLHHCALEGDWISSSKILLLQLDFTCHD